MSKAIFEPEELDDLPVLDGDGLLWYRGRWTYVPDSQVHLVRLIVHNRGRLTRNEDLLHAYRAGGGVSTARAAIRSMMWRVKRRFAEVGLELHAVRQRGVVLEDAGWVRAGHRDDA